MGMFSNASDLAIDLGSVNTCIYTRGAVALNEPSVVAFNTARGGVEAIGTEAHEMLGRTPANIDAVWPVRNGMVADIEAVEKMLAHFVRKAQPGDRTPDHKSRRAAGHCRHRRRTAAQQPSAVNEADGQLTPRIARSRLAFWVTHACTSLARASAHAFHEFDGGLVTPGRTLRSVKPTPTKIFL